MSLWKLSCIAALLIAMGASSAQAQFDYDHRSFEITPFGGTRFGGSIDLSQSGGPVGALNFKSTWDYGAIGDVDLVPHLQAEFLWSHQPSHLTAVNQFGTSSMPAGEETTNMYQWGFLYSILHSESRFSPYFAGGLGFTHFSHDAVAALPFSNRFSYSIGGGVKYFIDRGQHVGLRLDVRYSPTRTTSSDQLFCDFFGCFVARVPNYANQGMANLGVVLRF